MSQYLGVMGLQIPKRLDSETEQALIHQCRKRNFDAFGKVVDAYQARVLGFVKRMVRNPEEALDVTQEVFIKAFTAFERFDGRCSLKTWLFRIAYNLCVDRSRKAERSLTEVSIEASDPESDPLEFADERWSPIEMLMTDELQLVVEEALRTMSPKLKTVLLLHDAEELAYEEIASTVGVPVGTVKSRLFLARAHMKAHIEEYRRGEVQ
ncbi:MAG: sigma-70 family RNA polymerase sigma factor [Armatimonadetes bacterium]|nr:sigma-70 family RNA polymerase sigma factor [Armatimonadota bacterium]